MKVFDGDNFSVYVYPDEFHQSHHAPHIHIRWSEGEAVLFLPSLKQVAGPRIPKKWKKTILINFEILCDAWNKCNPEIIVHE